MSMKPAPHRITISTNHWKIPGPEHALDGWLEGRPTKAQIEAASDRANKERAVWKPNDEALLLVEQLKTFIGFRVEIQFWDSIMFMLEDEAPFPLEGDCMDVVILHRDGFPQAYLVINIVREIPTPDGYSPLGQIEATESGEGRLAPVSKVYEVWAAEQPNAH